MYKIDWQSVGKRLNELIKSLNIKSGRQFALSINADPSYIAKALKGEPISQAHIDSMVEKFGVNGNWLLRGEGGMFEKREDQITPHNVPRETPHSADPKTKGDITLYSIQKLIDSNAVLARVAEIRAEADKSSQDNQSKLIDQNGELISLLKNVTGGIHSQNFEDVRSKVLGLQEFLIDQLMKQKAFHSENEARKALGIKIGEFVKQGEKMDIRSDLHK